MRAAGGYPKYPITLAAARVRLQHLTTRITRIEAELARAATAERWAERDGWAIEILSIWEVAGPLTTRSHSPTSDRILTQFGTCFKPVYRRRN